ncbi:hypothetical protein QWY79_10350 [Halomonas sabkhae]|uniref:hypothetical protein n=1 Tax=Halomonas sabkhae TaxID=626223 RepID=UPI0025B41039|nr:hypothetical protein [Halomonas sabkhae]MDN3525663.1 hypothetical protein [Halomonas sabkhae]
MTETDYPGLWEQIYSEVAPKHDVPLGAGPVNREDLAKACRETFRAFLLEVYRETLRTQYQGLPMEGVDPLVLKVVQLHHWTIETVQAMSEMDLMIALADELNHFKLPEKAFRWASGKFHDLPHPERYELLEPHRPPEMQDLPT